MSGQVKSLEQVQVISVISKRITFIVWNVWAFIINATKSTRKCRETWRLIDIWKYLRWSDNVGPSVDWKMSWISNCKEGWKLKKPKQNCKNIWERVSRDVEERKLRNENIEGEEAED